MRKVDDGKKKKKEKIMLFLVATNVVASRPPECRPTGTPHARGNFCPQCSEHTPFSLVVRNFIPSSNSTT